MDSPKVIAAMIFHLSLSPYFPPSFLLVFPVAIVGQVGEGGREMSWGGETERGEGDTARGGGGGGEFPHV